MPKLTQDQQEALLELQDSEGVRPLLLEIENRVQAMERDVHTISMTDSETERLVVYRKCRAEGARKLLLDIQAILLKESKK